MNRAVHRWILNYLVAPPFTLLRAILSPTYDLLFGWLDRRLARKGEQKLAQDVRDAIPYLFREHQGHIVPNQGVPFPPGFDYAFVTVAVGDILIRFCRGRGELDVRIASKGDPREWHELSLLLSLMTKEENLQRWGIVDVWQAARLLEPHLHSLERAFGGVPDKDLEHRLGEVCADDRIAIKQAEWEINKPRN